MAYSLRRPHPAANIVVPFRCGCQVSFLASADYRGARQESCPVHEAAAMARERAMIFDVARQRKLTLLSLGW